MRTKRIQDIEAYILENKTVSLEKLCQEFHISMSTLRRDLAELLQNTNIHKIYGGVTTQSPKKEVAPFAERCVVNLEIKQRIAQRAAQFVSDWDTIFVDSGTTTQYMADALADRKGLTVITPSLSFIYRAMEYSNIRIIALPGILDRHTCSFVGPPTSRFLENHNLTKSFLSSTGISIRNGVTNATSHESDVKKIAVGRSDQVYLLADHSKFGVASFLTYCSLDAIDVLVSDQLPKQGLAEHLEKIGVRIALAE